MRIIKLEEDMSKFKPEDKTISVDNVKAFVNAYKVGFKWRSNLRYVRRKHLSLFWHLFLRYLKVQHWIPNERLAKKQFCRPL